MQNLPDAPLSPSAVQAFILAGGASRRMGHDKARVRLHGEPVARLLAQRLAPHVASVWLVTKRDSDLESLGMPVLYDASSERALVQGILTALRVPGPPWRFVLGCDMPGVDDAVLHALWRMASSSNALGCAVRKPGSERIDPLPSLWHVDVRRAVRGDWGLAARDWVRRAALALWTPPEAMAAQLVNLNTPDDLDQLSSPAGNG